MPVIVFDLDGTLLDTAMDMMQAANLAFAKAGYQAQLTPQDRAIAVQGGRQMFRHLFTMEERPYDDAHMTALYEAFIALYEKNICNHTAYYPHAKSALEWCREQGFAVAVCTNKPGPQTKVLLQALGIEHEFDAVVTPATLGIAKPHGEPLVHAITTTGHDVENAIMVGDTITDIDAARAAKCKVLAVAFDQTRAELEKLGPDAIIDCYSDFPAAVTSMLAE